MAKAKRGKKQKSNIDLQVVVVFIISILLGAFIYIESGYIGENLSPVLGGLIGWIKYIIPIGVFLIGISMACETDKQYASSKLIQYIILLICISTLITVVKGDIDLNKEFEVAVSEAYQKGAENIGGGALGTIIAYPLISLIGKAGTIILVVGIGLISLIMIYGLKPAKLVKDIIDRRNEAKEEMREEKAAKRMKIKDNIAKEGMDTFEVKNKKNSRESARERARERAREKELIKEEEKEQAGTIDQIKINMANDLFKKQEEVKEDKSKEVLTLEHSIVVEDENYEFPPIEFLQKGIATNKSSKKAIAETASRLQKTLYSFGVSAKVEDVSVGPTITRYELKPAEGVRVSKIANLSDDIALNLAAKTIRIEAPIPGKQAVGIEIPNETNEMVHLRDVIDSKEFKTNSSKVAVGLGKDVSGSIVVADIAKMPHLLIAGSTGSRKKCMCKYINNKYNI